MTNNDIERKLDEILIRLVELAEKVSELSQ